MQMEKNKLASEDKALFEFMKGKYQSVNEEKSCMRFIGLNASIPRMQGITFQVDVSHLQRRYFDIFLR